MERQSIPADLDILAISGMRNEAKQVLLRFQPSTIGQASRLAGITPADVSVLILAIEKHHRHLSGHA
jgi:tRNA uridine 5-carboxymethylaminomethyl modification enzyme